MSRPTENPQQLPYSDIGLVNGGPQTGAPAAKGGLRRSMRKSKKGGVLVGMMPPMGGRRRRSRKASRKSKKGGALYEFAGGVYDPNSAPAGQLSDGVVRVPPPPAVVGGRRRSKTRKNGKRSPWLEHVMSIKNKKGNEAMSLGDAMKEAKKTYKK